MHPACSKEATCSGFTHRRKVGVRRYQRGARYAGSLAGTQQGIEMTNIPTTQREADERAHQFRKKPVVIEAFQFKQPTSVNDAPKWLTEAVIRNDFLVVDGVAHIITLEGIMTAKPGDWIIRGVKGEIYPCKPDIFAATYEPAPAATDQPSTGQAYERAELIDLLKAIRPNYGAVGSRDV